MSTSTIGAEVDSLIQETLLLDADDYDDDTTLEELDIDSLLVVELAEVINMELGVEVTDEALDEDIDDFGDLKAYIDEHKE